MKTTLTVHAADYQRRCRQAVLVIDMDTQNSASQFLEKNRFGQYIGDLQSYLNHDIQVPPPDPGNTRDRVHYLSAGAFLKGLEKRDMRDCVRLLAPIATIAGYDWILIDTAPGDSNKLHAALAIASYVIIPSLFDEMSHQGVYKVTNNVIKLARDNTYDDLIPGGCNPVPVAIVPTGINNANKKQVNRILALSETPLGGFITNTYLSIRPVIGEAMHNHVSVWEVDSGDPRYAKKEMNDLMAELFTRIISLGAGQ